MLNASKVGRTLGNAGFQSSLGGTRHGFRCQQLTIRCVAITTSYISERQERQALASYAKVLSAAGFRVERYSSVMFVEEI